MTTETRRVPQRSDLPASRPPVKPRPADDVDRGVRGVVSRLDDPFAAFGGDSLGADLDAAFGAA